MNTPKRAATSGNTVSWPVCKSLTATLLLECWHWINFAAPIAVSIVPRQDWVLPSRGISNFASWQFSLIYFILFGLVSHQLEGMFERHVGLTSVELVHTPRLSSVL